MPFRLAIYLGVGGHLFEDQTLTVEDVIKWKCSLLIIDYVRIYEWVNDTEKLDSKTIVISAIISIFVILLLITGFVFMRQKKSKHMNGEKNFDNYDDICDTDGYDVINVDNANMELHKQLNPYTTQNDCKGGGFDESDDKEKGISDEKYLTMDKKCREILLSNYD